MDTTSEKEEERLDPEKMDRQSERAREVRFILTRSLFLLRSVWCDEIFFRFLSDFYSLPLRRIQTAEDEDDGHGI